MYNVSKVTPKRLIGLVLGQLCTSLTDYEGVHQRMLLLATTCALKKKKIRLSPAQISSFLISQCTQLLEGGRIAQQNAI